MLILLLRIYQNIIKKYTLLKMVWVGVGGPENDNFSLLYVVKMTLCRWVGGSKKPQNTLT